MHVLNSELLGRAVFYFIAAIVVASAILVVTLRNVFHSALFLVLTLVGVAGTYIFLEAEFLAVVQVLLYVGGIMTLIIFAVMLTARIAGTEVRQTNEQKLVSLAVSLCILILFSGIIVTRTWQIGPSGKSPGIEDIGMGILTEYAFPFEVVSIILLAALIGAIVISRKERK
jgi:NADH-quinone oxidoreductase subunit J